jgi:hypothetical protein
LVAKNVKVIAVVPNDAKALEPVFKRAQGRHSNQHPRNHLTSRATLGISR